MPRTLPQQRVAPNQNKTRAEIVPASEFHRYTSGDAVRTALRVTDVPQLTTNLTSLRNQWTIHHHETTNIASDDARLLLAKSYLELSPTANEVFSAWELLSKQSIVHQHLALGVFSALLNILSTQYIYHSLGFPILRALLGSQSNRKLNAHLNSAQTDLVLVALKLWNAMSSFASGAEKKNVYEAFQWGNKSLFRLYHMRRKGQIDPSVDPFIKPDIRTLYITFMLGFIQPSTAYMLKSNFLESHRELFLGLFKRFPEDPYLLVRFILETCWEGIWGDIKLKRTLKIGLFNIQTLSLLVKLYSRASPETTDPESVPADLVHHFLLALCTRPGIGLCFKDAGWYPREESDQKEGDDGDDRAARNDERRQGASKIYNVVIGQLLKNLKPTEDARQQELVLRIFKACPELVGGYWSVSGLGAEPRLSSKWLINIAWIGSILSLPVPVDSFFLPTNTTKREYHPYPPPLQTCVDNIIPSVWPKTFITKGLQSPSPLVQRSTALCLAQALDKYDAVLHAFREAEDALEEDQESGQWKQRRKEIEREIRKKIPNFEVIIAFSQQKSTSSQWGITVSTESPEKMLRSSMVSESALRLMWAYHRSLPDIPSEARFDVGKLLLNDAVQRLVDRSNRSPLKTTNEVAGFDSLSQLHILRLLQHSDQFVWSATLGETNQTQLYHLLRIYVISHEPALLEHCTSLIRKVLADSILFEHDPSELGIWLDALPRTIRAPDAKGPSNEELVDERETMIVILDKCVRECIKSPWTFVEASLSIYAQPAGDKSDGQMDYTEEGLEGYSPATAASPLLMTLLDMFQGLLKGDLALPSSATLSVATYLRRVTLGISLKQPNSQYARRIAARLHHVLTEATSPSHSRSMLEGMRREVEILAHALLLTERVSEGNREHANQEVLGFLKRVKSLQVDSENAITTAYDLVDWIRMSGEQITEGELLQMLTLVQKWHPPALRELVLQIDPFQTPSLPVLQQAGSLDYLSFPWAYLHLSAEQLDNSDLLESLATLAIKIPLDSTHTISNLFLRRLQYSIGETDEDSVILHVLGLWSRIIHGLDIVKRSLHRQAASVSPVIQSMLRRTTEARDTDDAVAEFVSSLFKPEGQVTSEVKDICGHWLRLMSNGDYSAPILRRVLPWVPLMSPTEQISTLDHVLHLYEANVKDDQLSLLLHATLRSLEKYGSNEAIQSPVAQRMPRLLSLQMRIKDDQILHKFLCTQMSTIVPFGFIDSPPMQGPVSVWVEHVADRWRILQRRLGPNVFETLSSDLQFGQPFDSEIFSPALYRSRVWRERIATFLLAEEATLEGHAASICHLVEASNSDDPYLGNIEKKFGKSVVKTSLKDTGGSDVHFGRRILRNLYRLCDGEALSMLLVDRYSRTHDLSSIGFLGTLAETGYLKPEMSRNLLDASVKSVVSMLSKGSHSDHLRKNVMTGIVNLVRNNTIQAEPLDAFLNVSVREYIHDPYVMDAFRTLVQIAKPKPAVVNRLLQSILHHPHFDAIASSTNRRSLVAAIHTLFGIHPQNTCQPSHVSPLITIYGGTLSEADRQLLSIFQMFEQHRKYSCSSIISHWNPTPNVTQNPVIAAIANLDPALMFRTCTEFPIWRSLDQGKEPPTLTKVEATLYDPVFLILFLALFALDEQITNKMTSIDWLQLARSNILCVLVRILSARGDDLRALGWSIFGALLRAIQAAEFHEKSQTVYILQMLARLYTAPNSGIPPRLPSITTLFFAHALRALYTPSSTLYPLISRFLLQRPEFDIHDPPMLYAMMYSSLSNEPWRREGNWKRERLWILKFLADGMLSSDDWMVLRRRHTWDLLATTFSSHSSDRAIQLGVLKVLQRISRSPSASTSLILRSNLLSWIEIQVRQPSKSVEDGQIVMTWYQILENLLLSADHAKLQKGSRGAWRMDLLQCLDCLLESFQPSESGISVSVDALLCTSRILQRISELPDQTISLGSTLYRSLRALRCAEQVIAFDGTKHSEEVPGSTIHVWLEIVSRLWLTLMEIDDDDEAMTVEIFDALTARLVAFPSNPVASDAPSIIGVAEWARKETRTLLSASR